MKKWLWLALIPSLLFADPPAPQVTQPGSLLALTTNEIPVEIEVRADAITLLADQISENQDFSPTIPPRFKNMRQNPIYVDVEENQLTIYPEKTVVTAHDLLVEGNAFASLLNAVEKVKDTQYIVLLLRPGSAVFQRRLRQSIRDRGINVGFEPWDAGRELISTPKEETGNDKSPVYFECRNQQLFSISLERLKQACNEKTEEIIEQVGGDETNFLKSAATTAFELDGQRVDFAYALSGRYVLTPVKDAEGYPFINGPSETDDMWFGSQLAELDPEKQALCLFVRPDSFDTFYQARALAWMKNLTVTCELLDKNEPIQIGRGAGRISTQ